MTRALIPSPQTGDCPVPNRKPFGGSSSTFQREGGLKASESVYIAFRNQHSVTSRTRAIEANCLAGLEIPPTPTGRRHGGRARTDPGCAPQRPKRGAAQRTRLTFRLLGHPVVDVSPARLCVFSERQLLQLGLVELLTGFPEGLRTQAGPLQPSSHRSENTSSLNPCGVQVRGGLHLKAHSSE